MPLVKIQSIILAGIFFLIGCPVQSKTQSPAGNDTGLFDTDSVLQITMSGDIRGLMNDRGNKPGDHPLILTYKAGNGMDYSISIFAKTRGHFRKTMGNCKYPPIYLEFSKSDTLNASVFHEQHKLKLVMPCKQDDYIIREWMAYRIYNLVTPESFRVRLARITLNDTKKKNISEPFYAFLVEDAQQLAGRNHCFILKKQFNPKEIEQSAFLKMAVFEYLIGNTDWSVQFQNIKVISGNADSVPVAVPYDFDFSGLVNAPYSKPAPELRLSSVKERRYRGYCMEDIKAFNAVFAFYNKLKPDIYHLYANCTLLDAKYVKETLAYLDQFYKTINDPDAAKKEFTYPCDKNGTGNIVIRGLKDNPNPDE